MQGDCRLKNLPNQIQRGAVMTHSVLIVCDVDLFDLNAITPSVFAIVLRKNPDSQFVTSFE